MAGGLGNPRPDPHRRRCQRPCGVRTRKGAQRPERLGATRDRARIFADALSCLRRDHRRGPRLRPCAPPISRRREHRHRLPDGRFDQRALVRAGAGDLRQYPQRPRLQLLLPAAAAYVHAGQCRKRRHLRLLHRRGRDRQQPYRPRAQSGGGSQTARPHDRGSLSLFTRSLPAPRPSTMCFGRLPSRSPRC